MTGDESFGFNPFKPPCLPGQPCYPGCRESPVLGPGEICAEWVRYVAPGDLSQQVKIEEPDSPSFGLWVMTRRTRWSCRDTGWTR